MKTWEEDGRLQAKERGLRMKSKLPPPWSWISRLQDQEKIDSWCLSHPACGPLLLLHEWTNPAISRTTQWFICFQGCLTITTVYFWVFYHPLNPPPCISSHPSFLPTPTPPPALGDHWSMFLQTCLFWAFLVSGVFCDWLLLLSMTSSML